MPRKSILRSIATSTALLIGATLLPVLPACVVVGDALNPLFISGLGFDPDTLTADPGTIIFVFDNQSSAALATFEVEYGLNSVGEEDISFELSVAATNADPSPANQVIDCPLGEVLPTGVEIIATADDGTTTTTEVAWTGGTLRNGVDYQCGDVIVFRLVDAPGAEADFTLQVEIIPGS
jgi:hypothetical protein